MRITLRTLIAGQCGLLNPHQKAMLDEQLQQHAAARSLYDHLGKLRESTTPRTPPLSGAGLGIDPASVARYLQRQLPADQVQAFERLAIESDQVLDELLALAPLAADMAGPHGLSPDRIERLLAVGMCGTQQDVVAVPVPKGFAMEEVASGEPQGIGTLDPAAFVAKATTDKLWYRYGGRVVALIVTAVVALLVLPMGSGYLPKGSAPFAEGSVATAANRQQKNAIEGEASPLENAVASVTPSKDRGVIAAAWEVAASERKVEPPTGLELGSRVHPQSSDPQQIQVQADRRLAMGDLSVVAGQGNLLGDPNHANSWHGWIDSVSQRCLSDREWQERLDLEIARRPDNWQPVLKLLWQGVPQAGYDPIWRRWLLDALVHEQLEIRVLASYQYAKLTGMVPSIVDRAHAFASLWRWEERLLTR